VRVPVASRIGAENEGWRITRTSLGHERATAGVALQLRYRQIVGELAAAAKERGRNCDPHVRQEIARYVTLSRILAMSSARILDRVRRGQDPGPLGSLNRLFTTLFEQGLHELAVEILGMHGLIEGRDPHAFQRGRWTRGFLRTRASTIGAGTAEIQRNTIAEQVLGLPHA
jgi:alkylation response protein AidB-like acyl-CoA dehydrogenase